MVLVHIDLGPGTASIVFHLDAPVQQQLGHGLLQPNGAWASILKTAALYPPHRRCLLTRANSIHGFWCLPITLVGLGATHYLLIVAPT